MSKELMNEVTSAVSELNSDIFDLIGEDLYYNHGFVFFDLHIYDDNAFVNFMGVQLWNSDDDEREYVLESNSKQIPIKEHLDKCARAHIETMNAICSKLL